MANVTIPQLSPLGTGVVSTTLFEADDNAGHSGSVTGSQIATFALSTLNPTVTGSWPDITQTWTANVAAMGLSTKFDYLFGSAQTPGPGQTKISTSGDLTNNSWVAYQPFPASGGYAKVNGEPQIYMPFTQTANFVFNTDHLALTATLDGGQSCTPTVVAGATGAVHLNGTSTPIANLNLANTNNIVVGQLVGVPQQSGLGNGLYRVSALVANTSVTLSTVTGLATSTADIASDNRAIIFLPYYAYPCSSSSNPDGTHTQLNFAAATIPSTIISGMIATQIITSNVDGLAAGKWRFIQAVPYTDGSTVTAVTTGAAGNVTVSPKIDPGITITNGFIVFGPKIRSAQMYLAADTTKNLMPNRNGVRVVAYECTFKAPATNGYVPPGTGITQTQFNAIPATAPLGQWPAHWMFSNYQFDVNAGRSATFDDSELDILEITISENIGMKALAVTPHGSGNTQVLTDNHGDTITLGNAFNSYYPVTTSYPLGGYDGNTANLQFSIINMNTLDVGDGNWHKSACIWTHDTFYWFIDDFCIRYVNYTWSSLDAPWIGLNLGCGALGGSGVAANMAYPINSSQFPSAFRIQRERLLFA